MFKKYLAIAPYLFTILTIFSADVVIAQSKNSCQLERAIAEILQKPEHNQSYWGIAVQDLDNKQSQYQLNAKQLFVPASVSKLFTTAAALDTLGHNYRFQTSSYIQGIAPELKTLVIRGGGDPSLSKEYLVEIGQLLKEQEITNIKTVVIDDSLFTEPAINPTWEWSDLAFYYGVPVNSLILEENSTTLTLVPSTVGQSSQIAYDANQAIALSQWDINNQLITSNIGTKYQGTVTQTFGTNQLTITGQIPIDAEPDIWRLSIPNPAQYALEQLLFELAKQDITVEKSLITKTKFNYNEIITLLSKKSSPELSIIIQFANQNSKNIYAESLFHLLGTFNPNQTSAEAIATTLIQLGIPENTVVMADGSGLSRHNLATPASLTMLLEAMANHPDAEIFKNSLAIAGEIGTLRRRFLDTPIAGNFYGKTGTLTNVVTLAGYLELAGDRTLALSILVNQSPHRATVTRQGIDAIVEEIYTWGNTCLP